MADDNDKPFLDGIRGIKELESEERNENDTNDPGIQINSSLDFGVNSSTNSFSSASQFSVPGSGSSRGVSASCSVAGAQHGSEVLEPTERNENNTIVPGSRWIDYDENINFTNSFSLETGVSSSLATQFSMPVYRAGFDISASGSFAGAHGSSEGPEENPANSFNVPLVAPKGEFRRTDDPQTIPPEQSSSQHNIGRSNRLNEPWKRLRRPNFWTNDSIFRRKRNKPSDFFPPEETSSFDLAWPPQISGERDGNGATAQMEEDYIELSSTRAIFSPIGDILNIQIEEDYIELSSTRAIFSPIDDISSIQSATHRTSQGSVSVPEAVSVAVPSGIQTRSPETGKKKRFQCEICGKTFTRKYGLKQHSYTHTDKKPYPCTMCGKGFPQLSSLKKHILWHSVEKPHACTECDQRFRYKCRLVAHRRTHTKEKPFACDICHKGFAQSSHLKVHLRSHTDDTTYECKWCGKGYKSKQNCMVHQQRCPHRK